MRIVAVAIAGVMAVCIADPGFAAAKKKRAPATPAANSAQPLRGDFNYCEAQSRKLGVPPGVTGYREWMLECMTGVVKGRRPF